MKYILAKEKDKYTYNNEKFRRTLNKSSNKHCNEILSNNVDNSVTLWERDIGDHKENGKPIKN